MEWVFLIDLKGGFVKMREFYVKDINPINGSGNNGFYKSDFFVKHGNTESRVSVYGTQPIYANLSEDGFCLADEHLAEQMCYSPFSVEEIVCHDVAGRGDFKNNLEKTLTSLKNEGER